MSGITTHILDTAAGKPGSGVEVTLEFQKGSEFVKIGNAKTNSDGRAPELLSDDFKMEAGIYRISFDIESYYEAAGKETFYPQASIVFKVKDPSEHFHVPLLISGFGYSTYRGS